MAEQSDGGVDPTVDSTVDSTVDTTGDSTDGLTEFQAAVVRVLLATEPGDVLAYGEVAAEAGYPGAARAVGNVLKRVEDLPWWRVVTSAGRLIPHAPARQAELLAAEGVATANGRILLDL